MSVGSQLEGNVRLCLCAEQVVLHVPQTTESAPSPITEELGLSTTKGQPARDVARMKMTSSQTAVVYSHHKSWGS